MTRPRIGITLGDPGGIGPEVVLKSLSDLSSLPDSDFVLFGSKTVIDNERRALKLDLNPSFGPLTLRDIQGPPDAVERGKPDPVNGSLSFHYFEKAVREAREGKIHAIVTAPISKRSWDLAGVPWTGHTHLLGSIYPDAIMFFWSQNLKVALYTHHIPLKQAVEKVKKKPLCEFILRLYENLIAIPGRDFEFLISGLNPHAGEQGLMGSEESDHILPAVAEARSKGVPIKGPFPPDVIFRQASNDPDKIVIALHHDQGLIPFKLQAFDQGVNLTLGLPFIRTSPDHGTAFDIAGKNIADPRSMMEAIRLAHRFTVDY